MRWGGGCLAAVPCPLLPASPHRVPRAGGQAGLGRCPNSHFALWSCRNLNWPSCHEGLGQVGVFLRWNRLPVGLASYRHCSELI